jgi:hypothetical protein
MKELHHTAVYIQSDTDRNWLVAAISNGNLQGSDLLLNDLHAKFIPIYHCRDLSMRNSATIILKLKPIPATSSPIHHPANKEKRCYTTSSQANQGFIILDNVFESLDIKARETILSLLKKPFQRCANDTAA